MSVSGQENNPMSSSEARRREEFQNLHQQNNGFSVSASSGSDVDHLRLYNFNNRSLRVELDRSQAQEIRRNTMAPFQIPFAPPANSSAQTPTGHQLSLLNVSAIATPHRQQVRLQAPLGTQPQVSLQTQSQIPPPPQARPVFPVVSNSSQSVQQFAVRQQVRQPTNLQYFGVPPSYVPHNQPRFMTAPAPVYVSYRAPIPQPNVFVKPPCIVKQPVLNHVQQERANVVQPSIDRRPPQYMHRPAMSAPIQSENKPPEFPNVSSRQQMQSEKRDNVAAPDDLHGEVRTSTQRREAPRFAFQDNPMIPPRPGSAPMSQFNNAQYQDPFQFEDVRASLPCFAGAQMHNPTRGEANSQGEDIRSSMIGRSWQEPDENDPVFHNYERATADGARLSSKAPELMKFSGEKPEEWPTWYCDFYNLSLEYKISNINNMKRLQKSLENPARATVEHMMRYPAMLGRLMSMLYRCFGQPHFVLQGIKTRAGKFQPVSEDRLDSLVLFASNVENLVSTITSIGDHSRLNDETLMHTLLRKLPNNLRKDWAKKPERIFNDVGCFATWLSEESRAATRVMNYPISAAAVTASRQHRPNHNQTKQNAAHNRINYHADCDGETENSSDSGEESDREASEENVCLNYHNESASYKKHTPKVKTSRSKEVKKVKFGQHEKPDKATKCPMCEQSHTLDKCATFEALPVTERWTKVRQFEICFACFNADHRSNVCPRRSKCEVAECDHNHHPMLHKNETKLNMNSHEGADRDVLFRMVPVKVKGPAGEFDTLAMIDEGSDGTLITESLRSKLGIEGEKWPLCLEWTDNKVRRYEESQIVTLTIQATDVKQRKFTLVNVRTVDVLNLPEQSLNMEKMRDQYPHLHKVPAVSYSAAKPEILLGLSHYSVCIPMRSKSIPGNAPFAIETPLGWTIAGVNGSEISPRVRTNFHARINFHAHTEEACKCQSDLHEMVKRYMTTESFGVKVSTESLKSMKDKKALEVLKQTTKRVDDGKRFETGLIWKQDNIKFPNSYPMAFKRLECVERKVKKDETMRKEYQSKMDEHEKKNYFRKLSKQEARIHTDRTWYAPHNGVYNPNKTPVKLRITFDLAAEVDGVSVNSMLLKGPDVYNSIVGVLFRFREYSVAVTGDIQEMFLRVKLISEDHCSLRFLWRNCESREPDVYEIQVLPFGARCSSFCAQSVKDCNAREHEKEFPEAVKVILFNHYVDDMLVSFTSAEKAIRVVQEVVDVHANGGFLLRGMLSNSPEVMRHFNPSEASASVENMMDMDRKFDDEERAEKVLGQYWNLHNDTFNFRITANKVKPEILRFERPPTKSELLSVVMSVYDPTGLIAHYTGAAKILMRQVWHQNTTWDEQISESAAKAFRKWWTQLKNVEKIQVPRCYSQFIDVAKSIQLHIFSDASAHLYAAAAYVRVERPDGSIDVAFVFGKTRVAPQKLLSIPRLELQGAVMAVRMKETIVKEHSFKFTSVTFHVDSTTVLDWIRCLEPRNFKPFVANRITEIQEGSEGDEWRWVFTKCNVADDATRPENLPEDPSNDRWFSGPLFLHKPESEWPKREDKAKEPLEEMRAVHFHRSITSKYDLMQIITKLTTNKDVLPRWQKVVNKVAYVFRAVAKFKRTVQKINKTDSSLSNFLSVAELEIAEDYLLRKSQWESFGDDIVALQKGENLVSSSKIRTLSPLMMEDGIVHMKSRIVDYPGIPKSMKYPIILLRHHPITQMIAAHHHEKLRHGSNEAVLEKLRVRFFIPAIRLLIRNVKSRCQVCKIANSKPKPTEMAPLPMCRLSPFTIPFTHTGVDAFGPLTVVIGRSHHKRYGIVFTCMTIRAVHIEMVEELSTDSFMMAFRCFVAGIGRGVKFMYSDNGRNFVGAEKILREAFIAQVNFDQLGEEAAKQGIKWSFNDPEAPWQGGAWERMVRSIKNILNRITQQTVFKPKALDTFMKEIENIINSQPLTYTAIESETAELLTPNKIIYGLTDTVKPPDFLHGQKLTLARQVAFVQEMADHFWRRWIKEYLPEICRRTKWTQPAEPLKVGDLVLIADEGKRNGWIRGKVIEMSNLRNGQAYSAKVKTKDGIKNRAASKLAKLDVEGPNGIGE